MWKAAYFSELNQPERKDVMQWTELGQNGSHTRLALFPALQRQQRISAIYYPGKVAGLRVSTKRSLEFMGTASCRVGDS